MIFPFFASFIIFILVLNNAINRNNKRQQKSEKSFWEQENRANSIRRQSLDSLDYISFSADLILPENLLDLASTKNLLEESRISEILARLTALSESKIVNLNYVTNTDLKAIYGVANLTTLMEYDQNYTDLITLLQEYASILAQKGHVRAALTVLETAIEAGSDIGASYALAASCCQKTGDLEKIQQLISRAEKLTSPRRNTIVRMLRKSDPDNG